MNRTALKCNDSKGSMTPQCVVEPLRGIGERRTYRHVAQPFAAHAHDHYVIGLIEEGSRALRCNEAIVELCAGDLVVFNPGDIHSCEQTDEGVFAYDSITIKANLLDGAVLAGPRIRSAEATRLFCETTRAIATTDEAAISESVLRLCEHLLIEKASEPPLEPSPHLNDEAAQHVLAHFCGHLSEAEPLKKLAAQEGLSVYALIRAYRNRFFITPMKHLTSLRVECACCLLANGVEPAIVAAEVGFADQPHLTRAFKQRMGVTPAAYQKMARTQKDSQ